MKHTYKDFITGKIRFTRGEFIGWTPGTGIVGAKFAIFHNRSVDVMVPEYLLTNETKDHIAAVMLLHGTEEQQKESLEYIAKAEGGRP